MFGLAYKNQMPLEIFLRYINAGIQKIEIIRNSLFFIPDKEFAKVLKTASERNLISINFNNKTIFMSKNIKDVIDFVEEYNFIDQIQNLFCDNTYKISSDLKKILDEVNFFGKNYIELDNELNNCMNLIYHKDYSTEIINLGFKIKNGKTKNLKLNEEVNCNE